MWWNKSTEIDHWGRGAEGEILHGASKKDSDENKRSIAIWGSDKIKWAFETVDFKVDRKNGAYWIQRVDVNLQTEANHPFTRN